MGERSPNSEVVQVSDSWISSADMEAEETMNLKQSAANKSVEMAEERKTRKCRPFSEILAKELKNPEVAKAFNEEGKRLEAEERRVGGEPDGSAMGNCVSLSYEEEEIILNLIPDSAIPQADKAATAQDAMQPRCLNCGKFKAMHEDWRWCVGGEAEKRHCFFQPNDEVHAPVVVTQLVGESILPPLSDNQLRLICSGLLNPSQGLSKSMARELRVLRGGKD
jgi:hypothetical protein